MKLEFEYGHGTMAAELPDNTDVFIPGVTVPDPPYIPEEQLKEKTLESIRNPIGMEPLSIGLQRGQGDHYFPRPGQGRRTAHVAPQNLHPADFG